MPIHITDTGPQSIYDTYTDANNYRSGIFTFLSSASAFVVGTQTSTSQGNSALSALVSPIIIAPNYNQSLSANAPVIFQQTWGRAATVFTMLRSDVTDTASSASSLLADLRVSGVSKLKVSKAGGLDLFHQYGSLRLDSTDYQQFDTLGNRQALLGGNSNGLSLWSTYAVGWSSSTTDAYLSRDLFLTRKAAASLRLGQADAASPVAQTLGVQSVSTGTSNTSGASFTIAGSQGTGTGAGGSIIFQTAPAGSTGTAKNGLSSALTIDSTNTLTIGTYTGFTGGLVLNQSNTSSRITWVQSNSVFVFSPSNNPMVYNVGSGHLYVNRIQIGGGISTSNWAANGPAVLEIDAANILAQRNGTAAQTSRLYNTFTARGVGTTNLEALETKAVAAGSFIIQSLRGSLSGTARDIEFRHGAIDTNGVITNGALIATITSTGLTLANALAITQGGTGGTSASTAITNLGIGTGVENSVLTESTSARTLGLTDAGKYIRFTSLSAITVTVPTDAVTDFPIASIVYLRRASTGVISLTADVAVTVNDNTSTAVPTGGVFALKKISANTWDFI